MNRKSNAALAAVVAGLMAFPALAQSTSHDEHHPAQTAAPAAQGSSGSMGMMGTGMMGSGGMMGPGMMQMMMGQDGMSGMGMMGAMMARHVEGRIAFLKAELKVTDAQQPLWNALADAMRANAKSMAEMGGGMMAGGTAASLPDALAAREKFLTARLDAFRKYKTAADPFYAALSDEQKKTADQLLSGPMGMGMMGMGMMAMR